jgi:peptide/nickel transport system substrate-binding protein
MRRRDTFRLATAAVMLAAPRIARAQRQRTLKFTPISPLTLLDPVWSGNRLTHNHAYMVFDTLYGLDDTFMAQPQMVEGHTVENQGTIWTIRLREGLQFHDGTPVLARDAVASIRRFAARDGFGQALLAATSELSALDDRTLRFRLLKPFPHLPVALAGSTPAMPCIMPERLAQTDPFAQVTEMIGSGPYRFVATDFNAGEHATYERFAGYVPRGQGTLNYSAGPKLAHFDRIEWHSATDPATSAAALMQGEVDWLESPSADQVPLLARNPNVSVEIKEPSGSIAIMRFNHLHPPFDNPAIRRALLGVVDQADVMNAVAGTDHALWRDRVGLFAPGSPLASEAGIEALSSPRDYGKVKRELAAAGYRGDPIVVLGVSGNGYIPIISQVGADLLRRAGMNIDLQIVDLGTMFRRWLSKEEPSKGGWNVLFIINDGLFSSNPATNSASRGDGKSGMPGWPNSPGLETLRSAWLDAADIDAEKRISEQMQLQAGRTLYPDGTLGSVHRPSARHSRSSLGFPSVLRRSESLGSGPFTRLDAV